MCKAISGIAVLADGELKIYTLPDSDSHEEIRKKHTIRDDGPGIGNAGTTRLAGGSIAATGDVSFADDVELVADTTVAGENPGDERRVILFQLLIIR